MNISIGANYELLDVNLNTKAKPQHVKIVKGFNQPFCQELLILINCHQHVIAWFSENISPLLILLETFQG